MELDHVVINTLRDMDAASTLFADLGFHLTPRGHHSLGSINHLMVTPLAYLELVGVPATGRQRQEVLDSPRGLNGLVFRTSDAPETYRHLDDAGLAPLEPMAFSRPVEIDGQSHEARFSTVRLPPTAFPGGRVYFCRHLTPELVWRDDWMSHPNGFEELTDIVIESRDPQATAAQFAAITGAAVRKLGDERRIDGQSFALRLRPGPVERFAELTLRFSQVDEIARRADQTPGANWRPLGPSEAELEVPSLDLTLICRAG
ncbi:Glyoxalase-like domain-containing protein [Tranquillimonas rosea]|uniref:Glyoxalase-like domain-containing protein n=1 Tax=Tranquillimonas rosea TaxID=641238 RepID=A0A1H9VEG4_9RHOB|nr:VOC family protein [Tranquillimonas rosea]SES19834.1 Glyoxalase-like domain-containing protein [Tranquillimonas rosea]